MTNSYIHIRDFEKFVRDKFKHIIGGKGLVIPRMAVKLALDDVFKDDTLDAPEPAECLNCGAILETYCKECFNSTGIA